MKLDKQIDLYSIDTTFFYTDEERQLHDQIREGQLKKKLELKKPLEKIKKEYAEVNEKLKQDDRFVEFGSITNQLKQSYSLRKQFKELGMNKKSHQDNVKYVSNENLIKELREKKEGLKSFVDSLPFVDYKTTDEYVEYTKNNKKIGELKRKLVAKLKESSGIRRDFTGEISPRDIVSMFDSELSRIIGAKVDELTEDIMIVRIYYFDIFENIVKNGYTYKGEKYEFWSASAGQIRTKKCVFVKSSTLEKYSNTIYCGLTKDKINAERIKIKDGIEVVEKGCNKNKYLAYTSLVATASERWEDFDIDQAIVVDDFEMEIEEYVDYIDYTQNDENGLWLIERKKMKVPIPTMDGCGISLDYTGMCRAPWIKGLLVKMPFLKFIREKCKGGKAIIKDIYGKEYDVVNSGIKYIFTKSQFKMWKYYSSWDEYKDNFKKYNCHACKCNEDAKGLSRTKISYQPLQSLYDLSDNEILEILKSTNNDIESLGSDRENVLKVLGATEKNMVKNPFQQGLLKYPEMINDSYTKQVLNETRKSMINGAKYGKIRVDGSYLFVIPDVYAFCEWLFLGNESPNGLLNDGEVSCRLFPNELEVDIIRNPSLNFAHCVNTNKVTKEMKRWYQSNGVYTSCKSLYSLELMCDWDGDTVLVMTDNTIINAAKRIREKHDIVPLYYQLKKASDDIISNETLCEGMKDAFSKGNIGEVSNSITKIWNNGKIGDDELKAISFITLWNNATIDYAKTLWLPEKSQEMEEFLDGYTKKKMPYFFKFIPDKNKEECNVEKPNQSVINRLMKLVSRGGQLLTANNLGIFDYEKLMNEDVDIYSELALEVIKRFDYLNQNKKFYKKEDTADKNDYTNKFIRLELMKIVNDANYIVNVLVKKKYGYTKSSNKRTLWDLFGDIMLNNLTNNIPSNTKLCDVCGERFEYNDGAGRPELYCEMCKKEREIENTRNRVKKHRENN